MGSSTKGGKAKGIVTSFHYTFGWWRLTFTKNYLPRSSVWGFLALVDLLHACVDNLIDMYPQTVREAGFGRAGGWSERGLPRGCRSTDIASLLTFLIRFPRLAVSG